MVGHGGSSAGSYLADSTSPIPSHCASIVTTSTLRVKTTITTGNTLTCEYVFMYISRCMAYVFRGFVVLAVHDTILCDGTSSIFRWQFIPGDSERGLVKWIHLYLWSSYGA